MLRMAARTNAIKSLICLKPAAFILFSFFTISASAQNDAVMIVKGQTATTIGKSSLAGSLGARSVKGGDEPLEGVTIEVKKDGEVIANIISGKKGKYTFQIPVSTSDSKNDYVMYVSKDGFVPKMININSYLSANEFANHSFTKYDFEMDLTMLKTTVKDIVLDKPSAKITWDAVKLHKFDFDMAYYTKVVQKEEQKMTPNPDLYFKNLAKKKKREEETIAKNKAAADAKAKADAEAKAKADEEAKKIAAALKAKEEADRMEREKAEALRLKHIADSLLAEAQRKKEFDAASAKLDIKKIVKPVPEELIDSKNLYDASEAYSINIAKKSLSAEKERRNKEKGRNLTAKYETTNLLTSLLNMVDEHDKKVKKQ